MENLNTDSLMKLQVEQLEKEKRRAEKLQEQIDGLTVLYTLISLTTI